MPKSLIPSLFGGAPGRQGDPFSALQQQVNRLFEDVFRGGLPGAGALGDVAAAPRLNISETDKEFRIEAELPGVSENDIEVMLTDDVLTIRGEKKAERNEEQENYHVMERSYGSFARSVRLPFEVNAEDVSANYQNGVLIIAIPKNAAQERAHRIEIGKSGSQPQQLGQAAQAGQHSSAQGSQATH